MFTTALDVRATTRAARSMLMCAKSCVCHAACSVIWISDFLKAPFRAENRRGHAVHAVWLTRTGGNKEGISRLRELAFLGDRIIAGDQNPVQVL